MRAWKDTGPRKPAFRLKLDSAVWLILIHGFVYWYLVINSLALPFTTLSGIENQPLRSAHKSALGRNICNRLPMWILYNNTTYTTYNSFRQMVAWTYLSSSVVQKLDGIIYQINQYPVDNWFIHRIVIYQVESAIRLLNIWGKVSTPYIITAVLHSTVHIVGEFPTVRVQKWKWNAVRLC